MAIPAAIREWLTELLGNDNEEPESIGLGEDPATEPDIDTAGDDIDAIADALDADPADIDEIADDLDADPAEIAGETGDEPPVDIDPDDTDTALDGGERTLPEPASGLDSDARDDLTALATENEALRQENADLRTRIAELGGDTTLGIVEEVIDLAASPDDEYDADADIADQENELAKLRGETTEKD